MGSLYLKVKYILFGILGEWTKTINPVILGLILAYHRHNPLEVVVFVQFTSFVSNTYLLAQKIDKD